MKRRTEVTIETDRLVVFTRSMPSQSSVWCRRCRARTRMMSIDDAALAAGVSSRTIFRWVEAGKLHSLDTTEGLLVICRNSLKTATQQNGF